MNQATLYLFIGYPGAGKTTVAKIIEANLGGVHLWADQERRQMFVEPTHSNEESIKLYNYLNSVADRLLSQGSSVIYDTNFNHFKDREYLRRIALSHGARVIIIWVSTPLDVSKNRAIDSNHTRNGYSESMTAAEFDAVASKLEPPAKDEIVLKIDGTKLDVPTLLAQLSL